MNEEQPVEDPQVLQQEFIQKQRDAALSDPELPKLYCNGFIVSVGTGDVFFVLKLNETPVAILNVSYTVAKTLAQKLSSAIANLEDRTGNSIMTTDDVTTKMLGGDNHD